MADTVLGHRRGPSCDANQHGLGADPERLAQLAARPRDEACIVIVQYRRIQRAAQETSDQRMPGRLAARILYARERRGEDGSALAAWHDEAEAVERVRHVGAAEAERDRCRARVLDLAEQRRQR